MDIFNGDRELGGLCLACFSNESDMEGIFWYIGLQEKCSYHPHPLSHEELSYDRDDGNTLVI